MNIPSSNAIQCPACLSVSADSFFRIPSIPVNTGTLCGSIAEAMSAKRGEIDLCACGVCGLIFNRRYEVDRIDFGCDYEVSLVHSPAFKDFQNETAERLISRYLSPGNTVLEIGCGNGEFLKALCERALCHGIGIDPSVKTEGIEQLEFGELNFLQSKFDESYTGNVGNLVCCLSMFEDVLESGEFVDNLTRLVNPSKTPVYFEVFNGYRAFVAGEVWSIHYEQCNYFSLECLECIFRNRGYEILDSRACYQVDQYLSVEAQPSGNKSQKSYHLPADFEKTITSFSDSFDQRRTYWDQRLEDFDENEVIFWGAGGKAITFFNSVKSERIKLVVDNNEKRQQKHIPGTGQRVIPPAELVSNVPKLVIISNNIYRDEIANQLNELGITCEIETA